MTEEPLRGRAVEQRILIAKGSAFLSAGIVIGVVLLFSSPWTLSFVMFTPLMLLPILIAFWAWLMLLIFAATRFQQARELGAATDETPPGPTEPEVTL